MGLFVKQFPSWGLIFLINSSLQRCLKLCEGQQYLVLNCYFLCIHYECVDSYFSSRSFNKSSERCSTNSYHTPPICQDCLASHLQAGKTVAEDKRLEQHVRLEQVRETTMFSGLNKNRIHCSKVAMVSITASIYVTSQALLCSDFPLLCVMGNNELQSLTGSVAFKRK